MFSNPPRGGRSVKVSLGRFRTPPQAGGGALEPAVDQPEREYRDGDTEDMMQGDKGRVGMQRQCYQRHFVDPPPGAKVISNTSKFCPREGGHEDEGNGGADGKHRGDREQ